MKAGCELIVIHHEGRQYWGVTWKPRWCFSHWLANVLMSCQPTQQTFLTFILKNMKQAQKLVQVDALEILCNTL